MKYEFEQEYKKIGLKIAYYRKLAGLTQEMQCVGNTLSSTLSRRDLSMGLGTNSVNPSFLNISLAPLMVFAVRAIIGRS